MGVFIYTQISARAAFGDTLLVGREKNTALPLAVMVAYMFIYELGGARVLLEYYSRGVGAPFWREVAPGGGILYWFKM